MEEKREQVEAKQSDEKQKNRNRLITVGVLVGILLLSGIIGFFSAPKSQNTGGSAGPTVAENDPVQESTEKAQEGQTGEDSTKPTKDSDETGTSKESETSDENSMAGDDETSGQTEGNGDSNANDGEMLKVQISRDNEWGESPKYVQLAGKLENISDKNVEGWILKVQVGDATLDTSWGGNCSISDGVMTVTNVDYNGFLTPGGVCDFGVILAGVTGDLSVAAEVTGTSAAGSQNQGGNQNNQNGNQQQNTGMLEVPEPTTDDWLFVKGNKIVDSEGKEVWLTGVNWFGYNTGTNTFDGLWACDLNSSLKAIADHGFNLLRIPISAELILQWENGDYPSANFNQATNFYLVGMNSLEIFDYVIGQCRANGLKIMIDIHCAKTDSMGHMANLWYTDAISTADYQEALCWMADRYKEDDTIIAYDLKNEPHGKPYEDNKAIWNDSKEQNNWKYVAQETALKVLEKNPNVLIMVEGTEIYPMDLKKNGDYSSRDDADYYFNWWGGNLRGVADFPVELGKYQNKLVYSPHDYGPAVYQQPWFYSGYDYDSLMKDCWKDNWFYIHQDNIAPLLIGEWGGYMTEPNLTWMTHMRTLIGNYHLHHTFWCFNANSGDTGGLVKDDFMTWDEEKYNFVKEVLWQENGKFVGLDHQIPLGTAGNGITLSEAKGL